MKIFQIVFGLALVGTLAACTPGDVVNDAKDLGSGAVEVVENAGDAVVDGAGDVMEKAEEAGDAMMEKGEEAMEKTGELMEKAEEAVTALSAASYTAYEADAGAGKKHVLFFHADWCGTCVKWDAKVTEALSTLPEGTMILKADYDTQSDLAAQYGVRKQSTAVFFNADGSVAKTEADPSIESLTAFFQ